MAKTENPVKPAPATQTPQQIVEKISKRNGATDVSKKDMRDSGTKLPPVVKKGK